MGKSAPDGWYAQPTERLNSRFHVGSFLDREGNKIWFCSPIEGSGNA
jgi:hypothetical protein